MTRDDYLALLDRALASPHGLRLAYGDGQTAHRVRAKLYHIREEIRAELRGDRQSDPALTLDLNGKPLGVSTSCAQSHARRRRRTIGCGCAFLRAIYLFCRPRSGYLWTLCRPAKRTISSWPRRVLCRPGHRVNSRQFGDIYCHSSFRLRTWTHPDRDISGTTVKLSGCP